MKKRIVFAGVLGLSLAAAAMPTKKELKAVQGVVTELMASDLQALKAEKKKPFEVAAAAEGYARDAESEAAKFLFLKGAFGLYVQGGDYDEALRVLNELTTTVKDVPDKVLAEIVVAKLKKLSKKQATGIFEYYERLERRMSMSEERAKLEKALKENPKSKEARHDLAVCLAVLGDWPAALEHFAAVGGKEAEAAAAEKAKKTAEAANLWWDAAQGDATDALQAHAASLYRQAIADGKLSGLKLTLAKKRIAEVAPESGESRAVVSASSGQSRPVADATERVAPVVAAESVPAASKGKYDWSIPDDLEGVKTLDFDLGCPEKMTFFAVPSGSGVGFMTAPLGKERWRVTRPVWISQIHVTYAQFKAMGFSCDNPRFEKLAKAFKGDPKVAVFAPATYRQTLRFFQTMNERFGAQLPKGWVFRPITVAEASLPRVKKLAFDMQKDGEGMLPSLKKKGYLTDVADERVAIGAFFGMFKFYPGICPDIATLKQDRMILKCTADMKLDCYELSNKPKNQAQMFELWMQAMKAGLKEENPFWYCDTSSPRAAQTGDCGILFVIQDALKNQKGRLIRVAVGYDYVGEWKREHGK